MAAVVVGVAPPHPVAPMGVAPMGTLYLGAKTIPSGSGSARARITIGVALSACAAVIIAPQRFRCRDGMSPQDSSRTIHE